MDIDREQYEENLRRRRVAHRKCTDADWQPCLHDECTECVGTGRKKDGNICAHFLSCPCPKCTPRCSLAVH